MSLVDTVATGNLVFTGATSTNTTGNITKGGSRFIHNFGTNNTFVGINASNFTMTGTRNTGIGRSALALNALGSSNTATGTSSLVSNTDGDLNTAMGDSALTSNTTGTQNSAFGAQALIINSTGSFNTAIGYNALSLNTTDFNTAVGNNSLGANTTGLRNTAVGYLALVNNSTGSNNCGFGHSTLQLNTSGNNNTALGQTALFDLTTGSNNIAIGQSAGSVLATGDNNIYINASAGTAAESSVIRIGTSQTTCFIAGINGVTTGGAAVAVLIDGTGQLGTTSSSATVKHDIQDMADASDAIMQLRPVTFVYNGDESNTTQYGLIAEEVDEAFPNIVVHDKDGQPETVQYHVLPVLLLNEMKKQQLTIEEFKKDNIQRDVIIQDLLERMSALEARA